MIGNERMVPLKKGLRFGLDGIETEIWRLKRTRKNISIIETSAKTTRHKSASSNCKEMPVLQWAKKRAVAEVDKEKNHAKFVDYH